jgi:hypothetical protein
MVQQLWKNVWSNFLVKPPWTLLFNGSTQMFNPSPKENICQQKAYAKMFRAQCWKQFSILTNTLTIELKK